jgi:aminomethyltransferase
MTEPSGGAELARTPLHQLHVGLGARMVPFAGYEMPVQYPGGIIAEHNHTRDAASLFDVSHMGQVALRGKGVAAALERLVPGDIAGLAPGRMRYTQLSNDDGGIIDDLMVTNVGDYLFLVINAARQEVDLARLRDGLDGYAVEVLERALFAVQGPRASEVLSRIAPGADAMGFMTAVPFTVDGSAIAITRSGYTGEDGFEISVPAGDGARIAEMLLGDALVQPAGLGARDSLRLEAGLCLYGHDIDETTSPVEAGLTWTIGKRRRAEGGFPGAETILRQIADGPARRLVGLRLAGRAPARAGAVILNADGAPVGTVTSGGFGPTVGAAIAMGYVPAELAADGTALGIDVRGRVLDAVVAKLPFVPHRYFKPERRTPA